MSKINDGGPAMPGGHDRKCDNWCCEQGEGSLTLRDYFAAHATEADVCQHFFVNGERVGRSWEEAKYRYADAMIAARAITKG